MDLAGQGTHRQPSRSVQNLDDGGYIMVVLLIGMAVSAVWMGAMLPAWRQQTIRQKEAELIFRGEEYARAIALYWRKNNQTLPPSIDVLVSQRYLRKKYLDPMTEKEFLTVGGMGPGLGSGLGGGPGIGSGGVPPATGRGPGPVQGQGQAQGQYLGPPGQGGQFGARAGISGVRSTSTATSIVVYRGQTSYSQFPFDYVVALQRMGAAMQSPGVDPGARGGIRGGRGASSGPTRVDINVVAPDASGASRGMSGARGAPITPVGRGQ